MLREEEKREIKDKDNNSNKSQKISSLYNSRVHCKELLKEILKNHMKDGFDNFEYISIYIKKMFNLKKFQFIKKGFEPKNVIDLTKYERKQIVDSTKKIKKKEIEIVNCYMDDLMNHFKMLEWIGIGFNNVESYKLNLSIKVFSTII